MRVDFEAMTKMIEANETKLHTDTPLDSIGAVLFCTEQKDIKSRDFQCMIGQHSRVYEVSNCK